MKPWLKRTLYGVAGVVGLILVISVAVYGFSEAKLSKQYAVNPQPVSVPSDSATIARGGHLGQSIAGCADCHGEQLQGKPVFDDPALGRIVALNLTAGKGGVGTLSDADYVRAIRHGVARNGQGLKVMPSSDYVNLSDEDLAAIIAWVKSRPPVDNELPAQRLGPIGRALVAAGKLPIIHAERIAHDGPKTPAVPAGATLEYGKYLAAVGCKGCHGPTLAGGKIADGDPSWPPASNLTPAGSTKSWTEEDFRRLIREGKRPGGFPVNVAMPWRTFKNLTDDEISALWLYLRSIPPVAMPGVTAAN